ncbi:ABC transporter substrate-binding protein [Shewanella dokdonensis]|uniref:ABC transporter substrate-binding protein n=1 Tax=Shewanella dokdonensis TaxID=712036 RepID=UPI00200C9136|nr:ABC transporter substrate-binding protein [Shewanella dokdonensis]MCL1074698.1 ABC transporter substrate-binding protein [Shewanella dokdonensis]
MAKLITYIFSLILLLVTYGCTQPPAADRLTISGPFEPISLDLAKAGYIFSRLQIVETLVDIDNQGQLQAGLATAWDSNPDASVWRFHLRTDVSFHNGSPLDANAVVTSLRIALNKPAPFDQQIIANVKAVDAHTVEFQLHSSYRPFAAILTNYTTAILAPASFGSNDRIVSLIGTGPYQLTEFDPPHMVSVSRFDGYYGAKAYIPYVDYITGHRSESRALMVQGGSADIVYNLDPASVQLLQQTANVKVNTTPIPRTILIKLNLADPLLDSVKVRQALSLALDRQGIAEGIMHQPGVEANQLFGPAMGIWHVNSLPPPRLNLDRARALMAEAGWQPDSTGILQKQGKRFTLSMVTYANRPELIVIATAIQAQWARLGVALDVQMENASAIPLGHVEGSLQTALMARNFANIPDPLTVLLADFSSPAGGDWGPMHWQDPAFFAQLKQTTQATGAAYQQDVQQLSRHLAQSLPMIPVLYYVQQSAVADRVHGFSFDPYERSFRITDMVLQP